jgi:hypothetical protein
VQVLFIMDVPAATLSRLGIFLEWSPWDTRGMAALQPMRPMAFIDESTLHVLVSSEGVGAQMLPAQSLRVGASREVTQQMQVRFVSKWDGSNSVVCDQANIGPKSRISVDAVTPEHVVVSVAYEYRYNITWQTNDVARGIEALYPPYFTVLSDRQRAVRIPLDKCMLVGAYRGNSNEVADLVGVRVWKSKSGRDLTSRRSTNEITR